MRTCMKSVICLLLLIFPSGCSKWAARPADVPSSAVHVADVFVDCSADERSRANRCTVYKDGSGDIIVSGFFELSGSGSEAINKELAFRVRGLASSAVNRGYSFGRQARSVWTLPPTAGSVSSSQRRTHVHIPNGIGRALEEVLSECDA